MILRTTKFDIRLTGLMNRVYEQTPINQIHICKRYPALRDDITDFGVLVALDDLSILSNSINFKAKHIKNVFGKNIIFETIKTISKKKFEKLLLSYIISGIMRAEIIEDTKEPHYPFLSILNEDSFKEQRELFSTMQISLVEKKKLKA